MLYMSLWVFCESLVLNHVHGRMVPLCGDDKLADISEPYKSVGNFMFIDPWIVNVSNCVRKRNNRIKT